MPMIEFKDVSKWYGSFQVLTNCTTRVAKGEVVVVCGPSGSGKSTLVKCVNGLEGFQQGRITVDGVSVGTYARMLFNNSSLLPGGWVGELQRQGYDVDETSRAMTFNSPVDLVMKAIQMGTRAVMDGAGK